MRMRHWLIVMAASTALAALPSRGQRVDAQSDDGVELFADASPGAVVEPSSRLPSAPADAVSLRVRFGMKDAENTDWSGTVTLSQGKVTELRGWRWAAGDHANGTNGWTVHTRAQPAQGEQERKLVQAGKKMPITDNGVVLRIEGATPQTEVEIKAGPGSVKFKLADVAFGKSVVGLEGNLEVERTPVVTPLAATWADEDYPTAAVARDGTIYVAWLAFTRGKDFQSHRERMATPTVKPQTTVLSVVEVKTIEKPEDFDYLAEPTGGEQIWVRACRNGKWEEPVAVTDGKNEYYRPAITVDGSGRVWVFYSAHLDADATLDHGNWELLAKAFTPDLKGGDVVNVSHAAGPDFMPAATTDAKGAAWVTWMGGRDDKMHVFVARQTSEGKFTEPQRVSTFKGNEWDPAIAADKNGNVALSWDTYEKGDYDVYLRRWTSDGKAGDVTPVAATANFEGKSSLAFDGQGQLWVAWEQSGELWGKDFGGLKKFGIPLYQSGRTIGVKVQKADGTWAKPVGDFTAAIPARGTNKAPKAPRAQVAPCYPRLAADDAGHVFLAFRGRPPTGNWRLGVGSVWFEYVTCHTGDGWAPAAWMPRSNNVLDNRPALVATAEHDILVAFSGDGRGDVSPIGEVADPNTPPADPNKPVDQPQGVAGAAGNQNPRRGGGRRGANGGAAGPDPNNNLFIARIGIEGLNAQPPKLEAIAAEKPAEPIPYIGDERQAIAQVRDYRVNLNGENLRIWRGEFHRHTEYSPDGGGDGGLLDLWRYVYDSVSLDWIGDGDHDYGNGREYSWWTTQKTVTLFTLPGRFVPMFSYERSVVYPEGHRNCVFAKRGVRSLPRLPLSAENFDGHAPDTQMLYQYLHHFNAVCASHTSATNMGTDWRDNDPAVEPFVEIYQGDRNNYERPDAPRSAVREAERKKSTPEAESFGGWRPKGFVNLALLKGYRLGFESSSDHISTHLSFCNVWVPEPTRENILEAMKKRRTYAATANIIADVRCSVGNVEHFMGEEFEADRAPTIKVQLIGSKKFANVVIIKDDQVVYDAKPDAQDVKFEWTDPKPSNGKTSYYYVRGEQVPDMEGVTGELVWASPMWIKVKGN